jgi:hypothetical protein
MQGFEDLITSCTEHSLWRLEPAHKGHVQISVDVCHFDKFFMVESSSIGRYEEKSIQQLVVTFLMAVDRFSR